jgi:nitroreductase
MQPISDVMELFRHQRAVRAWSDQPVPDEMVRQVIAAATHAPSGSNSQPWRFIVIRDQATKDQLSALYEEAMGEQYGGAEPDRARARQPISRAPVLIMVCVRVPRNGRAGFQTGASVYPAVQNLMLAARSLGLGTVLSTMHRLRKDQVHELLGIPDTYESAALIPLGFPNRSYGPNHRRPVEDFIAHDRWSDPPAE